VVIGAHAQDLRLVRSLSGPAGRTDGSSFVHRRATATSALNAPIPMAMRDIAIMRGVAVKSPSFDKAPSPMSAPWRSRLGTGAALAAEQRAQCIEKRRPGGFQFRAVLDRKRLENPLAFRCQIDPDLAAILLRPSAGDELACLQAVDQLDNAVVPGLKARGQCPYRRPGRRLHPLDCEQELMLLGLEPHFSGRSLAEAQELAYLESELGECPVVYGFRGVRAAHVFNLYRSAIQRTRQRDAATAMRAGLGARKGASAWRTGSTTTGALTADRFSHGTGCERRHTAHR